MSDKLSKLRALAREEFNLRMRHQGYPPAQLEAYCDWQERRQRPSGFMRALLRHLRPMDEYRVTP